MRRRPVGRAAADGRLIDQVLETWRVHDRINLALIDALPAKGLAAISVGSRGRDVAHILGHMHGARVAWLRHNAHAAAGGLVTFGKADRPTRKQLRSAFRASGRPVGSLLREALEEGRTVKLFRRSPVRWMAYLISHESHHRGQIAVALHQSGMRLPDAVAIRALWEMWFWGGA